MADAVSIRELRNNGGRVLAKVAQGNRYLVTNNGEPIAEIIPLRRRATNIRELQERWSKLPPVDPVGFRHDIDSILDQTW